MQAGRQARRQAGRQAAGMVEGGCQNARVYRADTVPGEAPSALLLLRQLRRQVEGRRAMEGCRPTGSRAGF